MDSPELRRRLPAETVVDLEGAKLGVVHDAGPAQGRLGRLRHRFPGADAAMFGHSHIPLHETGADGFQIFNPGSPTERRRAPTHAMGLAHAEGGKLRLELVFLDR
jgi:predicted phosphodiesterase